MADSSSATETNLKNKVRILPLGPFLSMTKYIKAGQVAVIINNDYGAGWSTWAKPEDKLMMLFDPAIVDYILNEQYNQLQEYILLKYPNRAGFISNNLVVEWVPQGVEFIVEDYDGVETIKLKNEISWITA